MEKKLLKIFVSMHLLMTPNIIMAQAPTLGMAADFVLYSSNGGISNTGISHLTGNVGTNVGSSTAFGNVNGVMHDQDLISAQCVTDLLLAYNQLNSATPDFFPSTLLGNGDTLIPGVYYVSAAATLNLDLTLNGLGDPNAVFIFQIQGSFSTNANSKVKLINGTLACNVFWKVEGLVDMATGTSMKGTIVANNAAIILNTGDTLEGRALSTTGSITIDGIFANTPVGCGSPVLTGPLAPNLASTACYAIFSGNGAVTNAGTSYITGDVGTNVGLTTGYNSLDVVGMVHPIPDVSTANCASDLINVYTYLNALSYDIELLYPAQFGNNLVLTPHTYLMNAATVLTDTLYLNALGNSNAVFVIQINGALSTSTYAKVILINGAQAKNVYWMVEGAADLNNYAVFKGTLICNNGAVNLNTSVTLDGRAMTTNGIMNSGSVNVTIPEVCTPMNILTENPNTGFNVYPNPFNGSLTILNLVGTSSGTTRFCLYNALGVSIMNTTISAPTTTVETGTLSSGVYFYKVYLNNNTIHSGKLICE